MTTIPSDQRDLLAEDRAKPSSPRFTPLLHALIDTRAFRRLKHVHFLGAIDFLLVHSPNGVLGNIRHTRYEHSLAVLNLSSAFSEFAELSPAEGELISIAALLHDVGHAPLSHSLEPVFLREFSIDHHVATRDIITGSVPLGSSVKNLLTGNNIDIEKLLSLIDGRAEFSRR